tara:strand:- start:1968 stop:2384 length:417 start_codon:yes stop_codon:yes gene_type:complete
MVNSRNKGASFERLIVKKINSYLESKGEKERVKRNLDQTQVKGLADIYWGKFAIECKRYGNSNTNMYRNSWWQQVETSAGDKFIPILIYKYNRKPIYANVPAWIIVPAPKNNQITYMCPFSDICENIDEIIKKVYGHK